MPLTTQFIVTSVRTDNDTHDTVIHSVMCNNLNQVFDHLGWFVDRRAEYNYTTFKLEYYVQSIDFISVDPVVTSSLPSKYKSKDIFMSPLLKFTDKGTPIWDTDNIFYKEHHNTNEQN